MSIMVHKPLAPLNFRFASFSPQIGSIILDTFIHLLFPYCYKSKLIYLIMQLNEVAVNWKE